VANEPTDDIARAPSPASSAVRKAAIAGAGGVVTAAGLVMLVTPGPGILVTLAGLGILSREFPAAAAHLDRLRRSVARSTDAER
jgi:hypothetical protein